MQVPLGVVVHSSSQPYEDVLRSARSVLAAAGQTIFAEIDQAKAATTAGLQLRPTTLFVFGNPKAGTPLMADFPLVALDLPLKLLVWRDDDGSTRLAYRTASALGEIYAMSSEAARLVQIDNALAALIDKMIAA